MAKKCKNYKGVEWITRGNFVHTTFPDLCSAELGNQCLFKNLDFYDVHHTLEFHLIAVYNLF